MSHPNLKIKITLPNHDYYVEMMTEAGSNEGPVATPVLGFVVSGAEHAKDAEEVALRKYPVNPLNQEEWSDVRVKPVHGMDADWIARCLVVTKELEGTL